MTSSLINGCQKISQNLSTESLMEQVITSTLFEWVKTIKIFDLIKGLNGNKTVPCQVKVEPFISTRSGTVFVHWKRNY